MRGVAMRSWAGAGSWCKKHREMVVIFFVNEIYFPGIPLSDCISLIDICIFFPLLYLPFFRLPPNLHEARLCYLPHARNRDRLSS